MVKLSSGYGDIPVAAYGIVKRIDQFPLNVSMGLYGMIWTQLVVEVIMLPVNSSHILHNLHKQRG